VKPSSGIDNNDVDELLAGVFDGSPGNADRILV